MYYDTTHTINVIFNRIEDLFDLSIAAKADYIVSQLIKIANVIISKTDKYQQYIWQWSRVPQPQNLELISTNFFPSSPSRTQRHGVKYEIFLHIANIIEEAVGEI